MVPARCSLGSTIHEKAHNGNFVIIISAKRDQRAQSQHSAGPACEQRTSEISRLRWRIGDWGLQFVWIDRERSHNRPFPWIVSFVLTGESGTSWALHSIKRFFSPRRWWGRVRSGIRVGLPDNSKSVIFLTLIWGTTGPIDTSRC